MSGSGAGLRLPRAVGWALTLLFVMACWVLFRAPDFATAGGMLAVDGSGCTASARVALDRRVRRGAGRRRRGRAAGPDQPGGRARRSCARAPGSRCRPGVALAYLLLLIGGRLPNVFIYFQF